jgi:hypothetical protein
MGWEVVGKDAVGGFLEFFGFEGGLGIGVSVIC